ncbi:hypothetical protein HDV03_002494 [Kappamyces sp. JEL0829]|nr:hypothetical protein HDV03_002494 [Kappamyces sp. JEL0829]
MASILNTHAVNAREVETKNAHYEDLVQEGKILFEAERMRKLNDEAQKSHIDSLDPNSYKYNAEVAINWLLAKLDAPAAKKQ